MASLTHADLVLYAAIAVYLIAWWWMALPGRRLLLWLAALVTLAAGVQGVLDDRWQAGAGAVAGVFFLLGALVAGRRRVLLGLLLSLVGAAGIALPWLFPTTPLPKPSGPHAVGLRSFELADASRPGLFGAAAGEPRRLLVRVWYPAAPEPGTQPRHYFSEAEAMSTARGFGDLLGFPPLLAYLKHVRMNAYEDAPQASDTGRLPTPALQPRLHRLCPAQRQPDGGAGQPRLRDLLGAAHGRCLAHGVSRRQRGADGSGLAPAHAGSPSRRAFRRT